VTAQRVPAGVECPCGQAELAVLDDNGRPLPTTDVVTLGVHRLRAAPPDRAGSPDRTIVLPARCPACGGACTLEVAFRVRNQRPSVTTRVLGAA
jgi:hypothetical protein